MSATLADASPVRAELASGVAVYRDAMARFREKNVEALVVAAEPLLLRDAKAILEMTGAARLPVICAWQQLAEAGCMLAYGPVLEPSQARLASLIARILRGVAPKDIAVEPPARLELALNLKIAKALGVQIPDEMLLRADEIID